MDISRDYLSYPSVPAPGLKLFFPEPKFPGAAFEPHGIGYREPMRAGVIDRPHGTGDYLFMCFHSPACMGVSNQASLHEAGHMMIWPPGESQFYGHARRGYVHSWLHAAGGGIESLLRLNRIPQRTPFSLPATAPFLEFLDHLHRELSQPAPDAIIAVNLLENWLRDLGRSLAREGKQVPANLRLVREHIDRNYAGKITVTNLARMARLSPAHFSTQFRHCFGSAPMAYTIRRRLHHAAYLLHDINLSAGEIGQAVGYDDLFHFSKLFKKTHGMAPREFRLRLQTGGRGSGAAAHEKNNQQNRKRNAQNPKQQKRNASVHRAGGL